MSISLNLLAFAFCLLVDGIKAVRESDTKLFLEMQKFSTSIKSFAKIDCASWEALYKLPGG